MNYEEKLESMGYKLSAQQISEYLKMEFVLVTSFLYLATQQR